MNDRLLTPPEVCEYLGVPIQTLYIWNHKGKGPRGFKVGKHLRYRQADIDRWLDEQANQ